MASKRKLKKQITGMYKNMAAEIAAGIDLFGYDLKATADLLNGTFDQMDDFLKRAGAAACAEGKAAVKANYKELISDVKAHLEETAGKIKSLPGKQGSK